jgi:hypothetical protein
MPNPQLEEARLKALQSPNIGKHGKRKATLLKEELRAKFIEHMGGKFGKILDALEKKVDEGNVQAILASIEQLIGKAEEKIEHKGDFEVTFNGNEIYIHSSRDTDVGDESTEEIQSDSVREEMGENNTSDQPASI